MDAASDRNWCIMAPVNTTRQLCANAELWSCKKKWRNSASMEVYLNDIKRVLLGLESTQMQILATQDSRYMRFDGLGWELMGSTLPINACSIYGEHNLVCVTLCAR